LFKVPSGIFKKLVCELRVLSNVINNIIYGWKLELNSNILNFCVSELAKIKSEFLEVQVIERKVF